MQTTSVSQEQYSGVAGERPMAAKPNDSNLLKGTGAFDSTTQHRADFTGGAGDRAQIVHRDASDILKVLICSICAILHMLSFTGHWRNAVL